MDINIEKLKKIQISLFYSNDPRYISMLQKAYRNIVISCRLGGPRKSSFIRCSRSQTTNPIKKKNAPVTHHIWNVKGFRKTHALEFLLLTGATMTRPVATYGWVKSTDFVLFVTMEISPTAASNT